MATFGDRIRARSTRSERTSVPLGAGNLADYLRDALGRVPLPNAPLPEAALRFVYNEDGTLKAMVRPVGANALGSRIADERLIPVEGTTQILAHPENAALPGDVGRDQIEEYMYFSQWLNVISSNVARIKYDVDTGILTVQFLNTSVYEYPGISVHMAFAFAQTNSKGRWVWDFLRSAKRPYRFITNYMGHVPKRSPHIQSEMSRKRYLRALALTLKATGRIKVTRSFLKRNWGNDPGKQGLKPPRVTAPRVERVKKILESTYANLAKRGLPQPRSKSSILKKVLGAKHG